MEKEDVLAILERNQAVIRDSHVVYTSGKHGSAYVNKDGLYPHSADTSKICKAIAEEFMEDDVEVVIAPAVGGVILSQWVSFHLSALTGYEVLGVYAEHEEQLVRSTRIPLLEGEKLIVRKTTFITNRGYVNLIPGKRVLVVEDILTTGGSAKAVIEATRIVGGEVIGLGVICNRGGVKPEDVGNVPKLFSLIDVRLEAYAESECPLCKAGVPINIEVGKGKEYLSSHL